MPRSASSTPASADSPWPGRSSTSCRTSRSSTSATPPGSPTAPSRSPRCASTPSSASTTSSSTASRRWSSPATPPARRCSATPASATTSPSSRSSSRDPARGRRHPQRPDRRHLHPRDRRVDGLRRRVRRRPARQAFTQACPRFVDFVEAGITGGDELLAVAHDYLDPLIAAGVDTLILGCTHYPLLTGVISYVMGDDVTLVSSAEECAKDVYKMLVRTELMRDGGDADVRLPDHRRARRVRDHRPALPRPRDGGRLPVRRGPDRMRLTVVGCSGSYPGPELAGQLLPARGRARRPHLAGAARPRQRRPRRTAPVRRPARRSTRCSSATCTPTTASTCAATT